MKKFLSFLLVMSVLFSFTTTGVFALDNGDRKGKVIFKADEITDLEKIKERAKSGITDSESLKVDSVFSTDSIEDEDGATLKLKLKNLKSTSQKIKAVQYDDGSVVETYVAYVFADCLLEKADNQDPNSYSSYDAHGGWERDPTYAYELFASITFNHPAGNLYELIDYRGAITAKYDSSVIITQLDIKGQNYGPCYYGTKDYLGVLSYTSPVLSINNPTIGTTYVRSDTQTNYHYQLHTTESSPYYASSVVTAYCQRYGSSWTWTFMFKL